MKTEKDKKTIFVGGVVLVIIAVVGLVLLIFWISSLRYVATDDAAIECTHVSMSAKMMGRIKEVAVDNGDIVEKGQLLVLLDDAELKAQESQSNSSLNYAKQNLILSKVNLDKTEEDFKRAKAIFDKNIGSREQYDHAVKALDTARTQYAIAETQVDMANAQLGIIKTQLLNTTLTAPINGVIAEKNATLGEIVQPGQAILVINDLNDLWITADFEETKIRKIQSDEAVTISIDAYPVQKFRGKVSQVFKAIVPPPFSIGESTKTTQKIPVKILFDMTPDPSMILLPGMSVEVKIKVAR